MAATDDELFQSAWAKWGQATLHAQTLEADVVAWRDDISNEPDLGLRAQYDPKRHGFSVIVTAIGPLPITWRLRLGDVLANYRDALDHLAWAIVERGSTPPASLSDWEQRGIYFPICENNDIFNAGLNRRLPGARRADIAKVRRHEPYKGPRPPRGMRAVHPGNYLRDLSNDDKHRIAAPLWALPISADLQVTDQRNCVVTGPPRLIPGKALRVDAELAFVPARREGRGEPRIQMETELHLIPSLDDFAPMHEWGVRVCKWIYLILNEFAPDPTHMLNEIGVNFSVLVARERLWQRPGLR